MSTNSTIHVPAHTLLPDGAQPELGYHPIQPVQPQAGFQPTQGIQSLPDSIREHMAMGQQMLAQQEAMNMNIARMQPITTLAQSAPEYGALMVAASMGYHNIHAVMQEQHTVQNIKDIVFCGVKLGERHDTTITTRMVMKSFNIS